MKKVLYILGQLEDADLQWLMDAGAVRTVLPGAAVVREGEPVESLFLVVEGELAVERGGQEIARLGPGEVFGDMSLLERRPATATVAATREALVHAVPQPAVRAKLEADTGFAARFYRALCIFLAQRLNAANARAAAARGEPAEDEEDEISTDALDRVAVAAARFEWFLQRVPRP